MGTAYDAIIDDGKETCLLAFKVTLSSHDITTSMQN